MTMDVHVIQEEGSSGSSFVEAVDGNGCEKSKEQNVAATEEDPGMYTYIARLFLKMRQCLEELDADNLTDGGVESMAILIHESMSCSSRNYHSVQHVFDISKNITDPIAILSALYHDCIYYHVDGSLSPEQAKLLDQVFVEDEETGLKTCVARIPSDDDDDDDDDDDCDDQGDLTYLVETIFGYEEGEGEKVTNMTGLNEFLSTIVAVKRLGEYLPKPILAQIAACIEATIPFRPDKNGISPTERLFRNMVLANERFELGLDEDCLIRSVQRAALLANEDVGNFGTQDRLHFLDNTWSLLPETNESLRQEFLYTVREFQHAVYKMNGFFGFLQPSMVFQSFRGVPSQEVMDEKTGQCAKNLEIGKKYVAAKMLALSVLAAFAELTGGDVPISLFMGDLPSRHHNSAQLEDALPKPPQEGLEKCDHIVYTILAEGRRTETAFDIRQSPLAAYLYGWLGDEAMFEVIKSVQMYPIEKDNSWRLLSKIPLEAIENIAQNMAKVALSRSDLIFDIVEDLQHGDHL